MATISRDELARVWRISRKHTPGIQRVTIDRMAEMMLLDEPETTRQLYAAMEVMRKNRFKRTAGESTSLVAQYLEQTDRIPCA